MIKNDSTSSCLLSIQPIIKLSYSDGQQTLKDKTITIRVYKFVDINKVLQNLLNSSNQTLQTVYSIYDDYNNNNSNKSLDAVTTLTNMWSVVSNAGKLKKEATAPYENLKISFTTPNETSDSLFVFYDISINFQNYGKYQLLLIVDGIESPLSQVVEILQVQNVIETNRVNFKFLNISSKTIFSSKNL